MIIRDLFAERVRKSPDSVAVVFEDKKATWQEIDSLSNRLAHGIRTLGINKGDRVAGLLENSIEFIVSYLALIKSGVVFVPMNYQSREFQLEYMLNHSESKIIICDERLEHFKVPAHVRFIDGLPRNPGGKVLKRELKKKYFAENQTGQNS
ncbi:MAG: AMP-binding protein [Deltaproteobacteria bacterium]|nr:AMP-binding protein [Deltaproteobacteria bacterium]MBW1816071.1 AMP-binding protein [Deltaproteobacteria bacterium]